LFSSFTFRVALKKKDTLIIFLKIKKKYDVHKPPCTNGKSGALTQKSIE
jgi:hypothetical protein